MTPAGGGKSFGAVKLFNPAEGIAVRTPLEAGKGWWAGAPGANYDPTSNTFYLVYRQRQPRELGRGVECRIAASDNGIVFSDIWALPKTSFDALSLERCSLVRGFDNVWRLYISFVSPQDNRWRIAMMEADEPDRFDASNMEVILTAESTGTEGVKDPNVFAIGPMFYMLVSYAVSQPELSKQEQEARHATGDIYNTGLTLSRTAAAISNDGRKFRWIGDVSPTPGSLTISPTPPNAQRPTPNTQAPLTPTQGSQRGWDDHEGEREDSLPNAQRPTPNTWDWYCRRIGSLLPLASGGYMALYDGSASVSENYEEKTGIAMTFDLKNYWSLSPDGPALVSPMGTGSLRYVDVLAVGHERFYYYELAREDGGHELRVSVVERE